ncbi:hypothetical protein DXG01_012421, partial [Tephrocybe rancida]
MSRKGQHTKGTDLRAREKRQEMEDVHRKEAYSTSEAESEEKKGENASGGEDNTSACGEDEEADDRTKTWAKRSDIFAKMRALADEAHEHGIETLFAMVDAKNQIARDDDAPLDPLDVLWYHNGRKKAHFRKFWQERLPTLTEKSGDASEGLFYHHRRSGKSKLSEDTQAPSGPKPKKPENIVGMKLKDIAVTKPKDATAPKPKDVAVTKPKDATTPKPKDTAAPTTRSKSAVGGKLKNTASEKPMGVAGSSAKQQDNNSDRAEEDPIEAAKNAMLSKL